MFTEPDSMPALPVNEFVLEFPVPTGSHLPTI